MNYSNIEKIITYGSTYRVEELAAFIEAEGDAYSLADSICAVILTVKSTMPDKVWDKMWDNLLQYQTNVQISLIEEAEEDEIDPRDFGGV